MKTLIQGQSIRFDIHNRGNNEVIKWGKGLHMHKIMNQDRYNGAEVIIPLDDSKELEFRKVRGKSQLIQDRLINEIKSALKKDQKKTKELVSLIFGTIEKYSNEIPFNEKIANFKSVATRIAFFFGLSGKAKEGIINETNKFIKNYISFHQDEIGDEFYIIQDIEENSLKIGDDLEILKNEKIEI